MKYLAVIAAVFATGAMAAPAHADSYVSLGIGQGARLSGDVAKHFDTEDTSSGRLAVGQRYGAFAIEGSIYGTDLNRQSDASDMSTLSLGVDLKYIASLTGRLEGYVRGGMHQTWIGTTDDLGDRISGSSWNLGAGLQYGFKLPMAAAAVFLDYNHQALDFRDDDTASSLTGSVKMLMIGVSVGVGL